MKIICSVCLQGTSYYAGGRSFQTFIATYVSLLIFLSWAIGTYTRLGVGYTGGKPVKVTKSNRVMKKHVFLQILIVAKLQISMHINTV